MQGQTRLTFRDGFAIDVDIYTGDAPRLTVKHEPNDGDEGAVEYVIPLLWTVPPFGGLRWWFQCPNTRRRCCKLYLPNGGRRFLARRTYRLRYRCQVESREDRRSRQCRKLNRALGGDGDPDWIPPGRGACGSGHTTGSPRSWTAWRTNRKRL